MTAYTKATGTSGTLIIDVTFTQNKPANQTTFTVKFKVKCTNSATFFSGKSWDGDTAGTARSGTMSLTGKQTITVGTWTVTKTHDENGNLSSGNRTFEFNIGATGTIGVAGPTSFTKTITVPQIIQPPEAPTIGTPVRVSDTQQTVAWTRDASSAAPYTSQQVQRRVFSGAGGTWGSYAGVATISTAYTSDGSQSWSDTGTVANRAYQYRVKASNGSGEAYSGGSLVVYTTPGAPSSLVAAKNASGGIFLDLLRTVGYTNHQHEIEYSTNAGSSWTALTTLGSMVTSYTWASPPTSDPLMFRARAKVNDSGAVGNGLTSGWRTSNTVQLSAPPNAPSSLNPNGTVYDGADARVFTWQHNPVDTSPQSTYQVRYRDVGAGSWTELSEVTSAVSSHSFAGGTFTNGVSYEWSVRTKGAHATASAWSSTATFTASTPPVASITTPDGTDLAVSNLVAEWTYFDDEGTTQAAWQLELIYDTLTIEALSGDGADTTATFTTRLVDARTYTVRARVRDGSGLWSAWDEVTFTTDFDLPPAASFTLSWDAVMGAVNVDITNPNAGVGEVEPVSNDIYRSAGGDTWELVAAGVDVDSTFSDVTVPLGGVVFYKVVVWSELPSSAESAPESILVTADDVYWSAGAGFSTSVRVRGGVGAPPKVDLSYGLRTRALHYFAGRILPVETVGTQRGRAGSVSFVTLEQDELDTVRTLAFLPAPHLIRTPDGIVVYCSIGDVDEARVEDGMYQIGVPVSEVER